MSFTIGVISDTHGLLRPEAVSILKTCDAIAHAGDIGAEEVLITLRAMAPIYAVRGNVDWEPWTMNIPAYDFVEIAGHVFYITHILDNIDLDPKAAGINVVISGHSHQPDLFRKGNVLYMNPGSAGPGRFTRPVSMGKIVIDDKGIHPEIIKLI
jgi:putative phosphoesterase